MTEFSTLNKGTPTRDVRIRAVGEGSGYLPLFLEAVASLHPLTRCAIFALPMAVTPVVRRQQRIKIQINWACSLLEGIAVARLNAPTNLLR